MNSHPWLRAFLILLATCATVVVIARPASAGEGMHGGHHAHHAMPELSDLDANGDGKVTAEAFYAFRAGRMQERAADGRKLKHAKDAPAFEDLDLDADGVLSADEWDEHHARCPMMKEPSTSEGSGDS